MALVVMDKVGDFFFFGNSKVYDTCIVLIQ